MAAVIIACENPDRHSAGVGPAHLKAVGMPVSTGLLADEANSILYRGFRHRLATGKPLLEAAKTGDGFDAAFQPEPGEDIEAALLRYGQAGYTLLWTPIGGPIAAQLAANG